MIAHRSVARSQSSCQDGSVTLELALLAPLVIMASWIVLQVLGIMVDSMRLHDAARAGVRAAIAGESRSVVDGMVGATYGGDVTDLIIVVDGDPHRPGSVVAVVVSVDRPLGPSVHRLSARAAGLVEPHAPLIGVR